MTHLPPPPPHPESDPLLANPVEPFEPRAKGGVSGALRRMEDISFQGRNLATAYNVWKRALKDECLIFLGIAGAMVPAGMKRIFAFLMRERLVDVVVSTGANLFHDCSEALGGRHYQISPEEDDELLLEKGLDRIYDTVGPEAEFRRADDYIGDLALKYVAEGRSRVTTREFLSRLGGELRALGAPEDGLVTAAHKAGVPLFCPAVADSSIGIACAAKTAGKVFCFDLVEEVRETARLAASGRSAVIYLGGGTPKNFIQQTEVTAAIMGINKEKAEPGHAYAIQITADAPHWGGLSGCTFSEARSWGKMARELKEATVHGDTTVMLPILASALAEEGGAKLRTALPPALDPSGERLVIERGGRTW